MGLLRPYKHTRYHLAAFAAPRPNQSGANWLANRALGDPLLAAGAAKVGLQNLAGRARKGNLFSRDTLTAAKQGFNNFRTERTRMLDRLDVAGANRPEMRAMNAFRKGGMGPAGGPVPPTGMPKHSSRMYDDSMLETAGRNYYKSNE